MANQSIRIRTTPGSDKNIWLKLDQDFDFLEILSLKISQEDLYQSFCANYGVVVGRVIANKGFGVPNAKISIFIPITNEDQKNELIKDLYPFKTPFQKNKDGIRYNLLLSKKTCQLNTPVGNFPTKEEVLDNDIMLEVFEKYYKYTTKTNNAGDFMLFGVPVGQYTIHMDLDMSDIGSASVRPYDLIEEGYPEKLFQSRVEFKTSTNLDSLPQIKTGNRGIEVIPFWGDSETCEVGITRADFDTGLEIKTNALFFGSIFTDSGKMNLNKGCIPKNDMGEQDELRTGIGRIEMIRAVDYDLLDWVTNNKITPTELQNFTVSGGELIDENGTFAYAVPMNLGHVITDEFGNLVPSGDPSIGVATKGLYRFKMNFIEPSENPKFRTANIFFPSLGRDFGGTLGAVNGSTQGGTEDQRFTDDINAYLNPELDFHLFEWKQLYTIAHYIKKYKNGANRFSHIGIKNTDVSAETNLFPFTNAIWKFDIIYYITAFFIDFIAFILKLLIVLVSLCIQLCIQIRIVWSPSISILGNDITLFSIDWTLLKFCAQICPFAWLGGLIPQFQLPCENAPNGEGYGIPPNAQTWASCNPNSCGGSTFICRCPESPCNSCTANGCQSFFGGNSCTCVSITGLNTSNNICLAALEDWKCCVKLNLAENRNVIRRVFNDAWVFGTAYLFQFKYKRKIDRNGNIKKEKFCGPGSDTIRGDDYKNNKCCLDSSGNDTCERCLLRGSGIGNPPGFGQYLLACGGNLVCAIAAFNAANNDPFNTYHFFNHNNAITGADDIDDIIYCNALMSTKIVSLGKIEMCEEELEQIETSIKANQALSEYTQASTFFTGTFYEDGWDPSYWINYLKESSYEDPRDVLLYLAKTQTNPPCSLQYLFWGQGGCHEFELLDNGFFFMKEVSKIYTDIELSDQPPPNQDEFNPIGGVTNPYGDMVNDPKNYGGFTVNKNVASRFSPCGGNPSNCVGQPGNKWVNTGSPDPDEAGNDGWDRYNDRNNRNNPNTRSNIPYYYFGIIPGRTALTKLKKDFFFEK